MGGAVGVLPPVVETRDAQAIAVGSAHIKHNDCRPAAVQMLSQLAVNENTQDTADASARLEDSTANARSAAIGVVALVAERGNAQATAAVSPYLDDSDSDA